VTEKDIAENTADVAEATAPATAGKTAAKPSPALHKSKSSKRRNLVILAVMLFVTIGYFAYKPIGNLSAIGWSWVSLICPLGALEAWLAGWTLVPQSVISFIIYVVLIILFGRIFCSWICPMPLLQLWHPGKTQEQKEMAQRIKDAKESGSTGNAGAKPTATALAEAHKAAGGNCSACTAGSCKMKPNNIDVKSDSRVIVLIAALLSTAIFGFPVFCLICPVGLTFATIWLVINLFNMTGLVAGAQATFTVLLAPAILLVEVVFLRKWCSKICPLGAFISLVSGANKTFRPTVDNEKCLVTSRGVNCEVCSHACPRHIDPRRPELSPTSLNNCTKCRECADACPGDAISFPFFAKQTKAPECDPELIDK